MNPQCFYPSTGDDMQRSHDRVITFQWFKQNLNWSPIFHWQDQLYGDSLRRTPALYYVRDEDRNTDLHSCKALFKELKAADIPVGMLFRAARPQSTLKGGNNGTFFINDFFLDPSVPEDSTSVEPMRTDFGAEQWFLEEMGELVDQLTVE